MYIPAILWGNFDFTLGHLGQNWGKTNRQISLKTAKRDNVTFL
jgi:hypothetical protein